MHVHRGIALAKTLWFCSTHKPTGSCQNGKAPRKAQDTAWDYSCENVLSTSIQLVSYLTKVKFSSQLCFSIFSFSRSRNFFLNGQLCSLTTCYASSCWRLGDIQRTIWEVEGRFLLLGLGCSAEPQGSGLCSQTRIADCLENIEEPCVITDSILPAGRLLLEIPGRSPPSGINC